MKLRGVANFEFDVQTENKDFAPGLRYQSGNVMTVDYTAQQTFGKWTGGGFWIYQVEDDKLNGSATPPNFAGLGDSTGNRFQAFSIGPSLGYNFGPVAVISATPATSTRRTGRKAISSGSASRCRSDSGALPTRLPRAPPGALACDSQ
jgi:hypothetical protein